MLVRALAEAPVFSQLMSIRSNVLSDGAVEAAIARVLDADRAARGAIEQARADAAAIVHDARERARGIAERAERRTQRVRSAFDAATRARLSDTAAAAEAIDRGDGATGVDGARSADAVIALAARLTGGAR